MRALLIPLGSAGDVHPFIGVGTALKKRGHRVTVITNEIFGPLVERAGLGFLRLGTAAEFNVLAQNPELWNPRKSFFLIAARVLEALRPMYNMIEQNYVPGETIVAAGSLALAARIAEEKLQVPTAMIHLQPGVLRSIYDPPKFPMMSIPKWFPPGVVETLYGGVDFLVDRTIGKGINAFRSELKLPPVKKVMGDWWHSPELTIGLFPEWFWPRQPDCPKSLHLTDFPLYDGDGVEETDPGLEEFLKDGLPPVIFTAGSAMHTAHSFFREAVEVCRRVGCRGALIAKYRAQIPESLPAGVRHFSYIPFSRIFPRAAAVVHAGGIGTTAQTLRAGVPQLVTPFSHDQPDNADRVVRMKVGLSLNAAKFSAAKAAPLIKRLLEDLTFKENADAVARRFQNNTGLSKTCDLLEDLL